MQVGECPIIQGTSGKQKNVNRTVTQSFFKNKLSPIRGTRVARECLQSHSGWSATMLFRIYILNLCTDSVIVQLDISARNSDVSAGDLRSATGDFKLLFYMPQFCSVHSGESHSREYICTETLSHTTQAAWGNTHLWTCLVGTVKALLSGNRSQHTGKIVTEMLKFRASREIR